MPYIYIYIIKYNWSVSSRTNCLRVDSIYHQTQKIYCIYSTPSWSDLIYSTTKRKKNIPKKKMLKGLVNMDDNMSNLTFASGTHHDHQLSASSSTRNDLSATNNIINLYSTQHSSANSTTIQSAPPRPPPPPQPLAPPPSKKKRSLPGNPGQLSYIILVYSINILIWFLTS